MACKIIVNTDSGNGACLNVNSLISQLGLSECDVTRISRNSDWSADGYDTVVVCGGDGTLHCALEKCRDKQLIYAPCGTLNEAAQNGEINSVGCVNGTPFTYVAACGSFTEIGYAAPDKSKKRWHALAYLPQVIRSYKCHDIPARLNIDGKQTDGNYTLLMVIKSDRCFGFDFNRCYRKRRGMYLLAVRSAGKDCLLNRAKIFFPLFRVFFMGVNAPAQKDKWLLVPFDKLEITLKTPQNFCLDGEKRVLAGKLTFCEQTLSKSINVVKPPLNNRKRRKNKPLAHQ